MAVQSEFMLAINQIAAERNIDLESVLSAVEFAVAAAYKKDHEVNEEDVVEAAIDRETAAITITVNGKKVDAENFGRVAAQTAKQVIFQKIREAEKEAMIKKFEDKIGSIENANVQRMAGSDVIIEIGNATALLPAQEQIKGERYRSGQKLKVYLLAIDKASTGGNLIVSRNTPLMLQALFENEVPEISNGSVEIKAIAREAGSRSKVAVSSNVEGVDPIGSCVGQRGIRIDAIMNELGNEKVDIIEWNEDIAKFIKNALSPAKPISIELSEEKNSALVIVADDQLSLAIGKEGQNVRLAVKLTGWDIDIKGESEAANTGSTEELHAVDISDALREKLAQAEVTTLLGVKEIVAGDKIIESLSQEDIKLLKKALPKEKKKKKEVTETEQEAA